MARFISSGRRRRNPPASWPTAARVVWLSFDKIAEAVANGWGWPRIENALFPHGVEHLGGLPTTQRLYFAYMGLRILQERAGFDLGLPPGSAAPSEWPNKHPAWEQLVLFQSRQMH